MLQKFNKSQQQQKTRQFWGCFYDIAFYGCKRSMAFAKLFLVCLLCLSDFWLSCLLVMFVSLLDKSQKTDKHNKQTTFYEISTKKVIPRSVCLTGCSRLKIVKSARKRQFCNCFGNFLCFLRLWEKRPPRSIDANWGSQWSSRHKFPTFLEQNQPSD